MLARKVGVSRDEIAKMVEKGLIPASVGIAAMREGMREFFGGGMERQSKTLAGMWSNFKDQLFLTSAAIGAKLLPALKAMIPSLMDTLRAVGDIAVVVAELLVPAFKVLAPLLQATANLLTDITAQA